MNASAMLSPFDLNLRHLRCVPAVIAHGSLSAAAHAVSLSQPALTQGLRKLERQLGAQLFERRSDGVTATAGAERLARRVTAAFAQLAAATRGGMRGGMRGGRGFARPEHVMTATQLAAFRHLADAGSFVAAAAASGLSQPAIHRAVRDLEQICATALLERRGRGVVLTAAGRRIARGIRLAASEIAAGIAEVGDAPRPGGRITIGAMPLSRALVLPQAIAWFVAAVPGTVIDVVEGSWRELVEPLRDGIIDVMIGALRDDALPGLEQRALFTDRLVTIGRAGHPLAGVEDPSLAALGGYPWIVAAPATPLRLRWDALFAGGTPPPAPIECGSVMVIRGILKDSDLLTLLSPDQVALEIESGMLTTIGRPLPLGVRTIGLTTREGWRPTAAQATLLALLERAAIETRVQENK